MTREFFDTNVLLYAVDSRDAKKRKKAQDLVRTAMKSRGGVLSTQVLQEYFVNATGKLGVPAELARDQLKELARLDVVPVSVELVFEAVDLHRTHSLSLWDALVVRAAIAGGCKRILTEDMQDGAVIDGVTIENPFA